MSASTLYVKNRAATAAGIYTLATNSGSVATNVTPLDANMIAIAVPTNYNLLAGVIDDNTTNHTGHSLKVYDILAPASPLLVSNFNFLAFGSNTNSGNANFAAGVDTDGTRIVGI